MNVRVIIILMLICHNFLLSQIGIGTLFPDNSSLLDLESSSKGILVPRVSSLQRVAIVSPANGLMVFDTDANLFYYYNTANSTWFPMNIASIRSISSTSYTLSINDNGRVLDFTSDLPITLTIPNTLPTGFQVSITQAGLGSVTLSAAAGMTIQSRWGGTRSSGRWAKIGLEVRAVGSVILSGDVQ